MDFQIVPHRIKIETPIKQPLVITVPLVGLALKVMIDSVGDVELSWFEAALTAAQN